MRGGGISSVSHVEAYCYWGCAIGHITVISLPSHIPIVIMPLLMYILTLADLLHYYHTSFTPTSVV